jgi:hypothetical protein
MSDTFHIPHGLKVKWLYPLLCNFALENLLKMSKKTRVD